MIENDYEKNLIIKTKAYAKILFYEKNEKIRCKKARGPCQTKNGQEFYKSNFVQ